MSTATEERVDTIEIVDLEELFKKDVPCVYAKTAGCTEPARWVAHLNCGHAHNMCTRHKGILMGMLAKGETWECGISKVMITDATWTPL